MIRGIDVLNQSDHKKIYFILICLIPFLSWDRQNGERACTIHGEETLYNQEPRYFSGSDYEIGTQRAKVYRYEMKAWEGQYQKLLDGSNGSALKLAFHFRLTEIQDHFPFLLDEWRGMADGSGIPFEDIALVEMGEGDIRRIAGLEVYGEDGGKDHPESCSAFAMAHSDRGPILGKTSDTHGLNTEKIFDIEIVEYADSYRLLMCGYGILNDQGLAVGDANAHYRVYTRSGSGRAKDLALIVARYCPDVDSALSYLQQYIVTDDGRHLCVADKSGKAAAVELGNGDLKNIRMADSTGYVYVTNTSPSDSMRIHDTNDEDYRQNSDSRLATFERMFSDPGFEFTFDNAKAIITDHDTVGAICQHGDEYEWQWHTVRSRLILPAEGKYYLLAKGDETGSWHPCLNDWREYEFETATSIEPKAVALRPESMKLEQNYPNPFNSQTTISYILMKDEYVEVTVYNLNGLKVKVLKSTVEPKGNHSVVWDGTDESGIMVASGLYYYQLKTKNEILTKRMTLIK